MGLEVDLQIGFEENAGRKQQIADDILRSLPRWFGIEEAIVEYVESVKELPFITLTLSDRAVGFCALRINYDISADLYVLGILEDFHGMGMGTRMVEFIQDYCRDKGIRYMTVKTLSEKHPDTNYIKTRKFYEKCGFRPLEDFPELWGENSPCLYMLKEVE
ncbi:MAG: GNAT family N-acetyltransferase [Candidatus Aegiribacteria sp.]|nr:GNAT family N-acetyltransferase [Candidatus Aegiribacteria sp.]MBD3295285.1 GNAT family N-acetyltransferase [Candidatus Fermentibacteria bacterium]